jgi:hypothetical protein
MKQELKYLARLLVEAVSPNRYYITLTKITSRIKYARKILAAKHYGRFARDLSSGKSQPLGH